MSGYFHPFFLLRFMERKKKKAERALTDSTVITHQKKQEKWNPSGQASFMY